MTEPERFIKKIEEHLTVATSKTHCREMMREIQEKAEEGRNFFPRDMKTN